MLVILKNYTTIIQKTVLIIILSLSLGKNHKFYNWEQHYKLNLIESCIKDLMKWMLLDCSLNEQKEIGTSQFLKLINL